MSYIVRGNMTAEVLGRDFTQIGNRLLRDKRLSLKAKGLFGVIASHTDGFDISPERLRSWCSDGLASIKSGLQELERFGYLVRTQGRGADGRPTTGEYQITDMPWWELGVENRPAVPTSDDASGAGRQADEEDGAPAEAGNAPTSGNADPTGRNGRSRPEVENRTPVPTCEDATQKEQIRRSGPEVDFPPAENRIPKKTTSKNTNPEDDEIAPSARSAADGRRPSTGSRARAMGGYAAPGNNHPRLTQEQKQAVQAVRDLLPPDFNRTLPVRTPRNIADNILAGLAAGQAHERTPEQLVRFRVMPRWDGYWAAKFHAGELGKQPFGPLSAMVAADKTAHERCDERVDVDSGYACSACEVRKTDRAADRKRQSQPAPAPTVPVPRFREPGRPKCPGCRLPLATASEPELCLACRGEDAYAGSI